MDLFDLGNVHFDFGPLCHRTLVPPPLVPPMPKSVWPALLHGMLPENAPISTNIKFVVVVGGVLTYFSIKLVMLNNWIQITCTSFSLRNLIAK